MLENRKTNPLISSLDFVYVQVFIIITRARRTNTRLESAWGERRQFRPNSNKGSHVNKLSRKKMRLLEEDRYERKIQRKQPAKTGTAFYFRNHIYKVLWIEKNLCECGALTGILPV